MIPLFHDFTDETVLVFGGGSVGARKARRFAEEAVVLVISPEFDESEFGDAKRVRHRPGPDAVREWVDRTDPVLVVAATDDDAINDAIADAARDHGALVNRADSCGERERGSVVVPATVRDGPVTLATSTDGTSPALSKYLREQFEARFSDAGEMADLSAEIRTRLKSEGVPPAKRRTAVTRVVSSDRVWKALDSASSNPHHVASDVISNNSGDSA